MPLRTGSLRFIGGRIGGENVPRRSLLTLGQKWPDTMPDNRYWIAADPLASPMQHPGGITLGAECATLIELERVAAAIREDLENVLVEARAKGI